MTFHHDPPHPADPSRAPLSGASRMSQSHGHHASRRAAALLSLWVGVGMLAVKWTAYALTGSHAILSDALESIVHVAANGFAFLSEAYLTTDSTYDARVTVPVLWDKQSGVIVSNESADILRMLGTAFAPLASHPVELCPEELRDDIDALNDRIYDTVNNAVYKAGFARRQDVYEREVAGLFGMLDELDGRLADRRFLFGPEPVETDWHSMPQVAQTSSQPRIRTSCGASSSAAPPTHNAIRPSTKLRRPKRAISRPVHGAIAVPPR